MLVQLIPAEGLGHGRPLVLPVRQVLIMQDNGTPICVAGEYGQKGTQMISMVDDEDFNRTLIALGINLTVVVDTLQLPQPPPGAKLLTGPRPHPVAKGTKRGR